MSDQGIGVLITTAVVALIIFLVCREIVTWYFKLNQIVARLDTVIKHLETISSSVPPPIIATAAKLPQANPGLPPAPLKGGSPNRPGS
jgi:hypothetical protein